MKSAAQHISLLVMAFGIAVAPLHGQVETALDRGEAWLVAAQNPDGSFGPASELAPRDSALSVLALTGDAAVESAVIQGAIYLQGVPEASAHFRSQRALALAAAGRTFRPLLDSLLDFRNGGGIGAFSEHQSTLLDTAFAVEALALDEGGRLVDIVGLLDYLQLHQRADGAWGVVADDTGDVYSTSQILLALTCLEQLTVASEVADRALAYLVGRQQAGGTFGSVVETAVAYRALLAAGVSPSDLAFGSPVPALLAAQRANGSWEDDAYVTAEVMRALRRHLPNLKVVDLVASSDFVVPGALVRLAVTVRNTGPVASGDAALAVRLDADGGEDLVEVMLPALGPGQSITLDADVDTTGREGALDLVAVADSRDEVAEADEDDNTATVRLTLHAGPDLAVFAPDLSVVPAAPRPDQSFDLLIQVRNLGEAEVASFGYRVSRLVAGTAAEVLASGSAGPVEAGGARLLTMPLALAEDEHTVDVVVDPEGLVEEENEDNNRSTLSFFVIDPSRPDLAVLAGDVALAPAAPSPGETATVTVTVRNLGEEDATAEVVLYENDSAGLELGRQTVDVAAGGSAGIAPSFVVGAGTYAVTAVADPGQQVLETDESNNLLTLVFRDLPDLAVGYDNLELSPLSPLAGDPVDVTVTVRNAGTASAFGVDLEVLAEDGSAPLFTHTFAEIPAAANRQARFTWTATAGLTAFAARVDPGGTIVERSESNNQAVREVAVPRATGPDLTVGTVDRGGLVESAADLTVAGSVTVEIVNAGDADVDEPFQVRLFEDRDGDGRRGTQEPVLASTVIESPLPSAATTMATLDVDAAPAFFHALVWVEVDAGDVVAEQREDNNRAALYGDCEVAPAAAGLEPVEEWVLPGVEVETAPVVVQLSDDNGDGRIDSRDTPDVVFQTADAEGNAVLAVSGLDGGTLWTFRSTPANPITRQLGQVAAADLDGDGVAEVIAHQRDGRLVALDHAGRPAWVSDRVEGVGDRGLSGPLVADLDGDGVPEIVLGRAVLSNAGKLLALGTANRGRNTNYYGPLGTTLVPGATDYAHPVVADVDLDGVAEIVAGDAVYRLNGGVLEVVWDQTVPDKLMVDGFSAVGNLDADPEAEIVYVSSDQILVLNHDGSTFASRRLMTPFAPFLMPTYWGGPPAIADVDGDGRANVLVATATELIAFEPNLGTLWRTPIGPDFGGITAVTAFDLDGDGVREVLFLDETTFYVFDGATGAVIYSRPNRSKTGTEYPVAADVDGDGQVEILVPSNVGPNGDASTQGLHVLGHPSWQGTRPIWNQYGYQPTHVLLDGTVPSAPAPGWLATNTYRVNREQPRPVLYRPNLTVSRPRVGEATAEGVPITLRVGNGGRSSVGPGHVVALYAGGAEPLATAVVERGLRAGAWLDVTVWWQAATPAGTLITAAADATGLIEECDEADNEVVFELTETLLPDLLLAADGLAAPATAEVGRRVHVTAEVANGGKATAPPSLVRLFLGNPATAPDAPAVAEAAAPAVAPGQSATVTLTWDTRSLAPGVYPLYARVDAGDVVLESDETNNAGLRIVELVVPSVPDLAAGALRAEPSLAEEGDQVLVTAIMANRGADLLGGFTAALRLNNAEIARQAAPADLASGELRELTFAVDTLGRRGVLALEVVVDPDGVVSEADETNNRAATELTVTASSLSLAIGSGRLAYLPNEDVAVAAVARNLGGGTTARLSVRVVDAFGAEVARIADETLALAAGETSRSLTWNTGSVLPGPYSLIAELERDGVIRARAVSGLSVAATLTGQATLVAHRDVYPPLDVVLLSGAVTNTSANTPLSEGTAGISIVGPSSAEVFTTSRAIGFLGPQARLPIQAAWAIGDAAPGPYTARLGLRDRLGRLVAFAETAFLVEDSSQTGAGLRGDLALSAATLGAGAPLVATYEVRNLGNADVAGLVLRLDLLDLSTQEILDSQDAVVDLARRQVLTDGFVFSTLDLPAGGYLAVLRALPPGGAVRLDSAPFTVDRGVSIADVTVVEGDGGSRTARFDVTLSAAAAETVTVGYATRDASALAALDYVATAGTLSFAPGETLQTVEVTVLGDLDAEIDEVFLVTLSGPEGVLLGDAQAVGTIVDEEGCASPNLLVNPDAEDVSPGDGAPGWTVGGGVARRFADPEPLAGVAAFGLGPGSEIAQSIDVAAFAAAIDAGGQAFALDAFVREAAAGAGAGRLIVELLDEDALPLEVYDATGVPGVDGWQRLGEVVTAPAGTRTLRFRLANEAAAELYADRLSVHSLGRQTVTIADAAAGEGDSGTRPAAFRVTLACPATGAVGVAYTTVPGTAAVDVDYLSATGTLAFAAGELEKLLPVEVVGDTVDEDDETFSLVLDASPDAVVLRRVATGTVRDDDGEVAVAAGDVTVIEGDSGTVDAVFEVTLSAPSGRVVKVDYATAPGTAAAGDYLPASGTLSFAPGETVKTVTVAVNGDVVDEEDEVFLLRLANPLRATLADAEGEAVIRDDDEVGISIDDVVVLEGDEGETTELVFTVALSLASDRQVVVAYATADGTALAGEDYQAASGTLVFAPSESAATLRVTALGDAVVEGQETFLVVLSAPVNGQLARPEGTGTLFDDDAILISVDDAVVYEKNLKSGVLGEAVIRVTLNRASSEEVSVAYTTADATALAGGDYVPVFGRLVLPPGATSGVVRVTMVDDAVYEPEERFTLVLSDPQGGDIVDAEADVLVFDDDGWSLAFSSGYNGQYDPEPVEGCVVLTDERYKWSGAAAWQRQRIDLGRSFDKTFRVYFGDRDEAGFGMTFTLQSSGPTAVGAGSVYLGILGLKPSFGVEMATSPESGAVRDDHTSIHVNGTTHKSTAAISHLAGNVALTPLLAGALNVEDGQEHLLRVVWNAATHVLDVHFDGDSRLYETRDAVTEIFGGASDVFYGFTAGVNNVNNNRQYFCETAACVEGEPTRISVGDVRLVEGDAGTVQAIFPVTLSCPHDQEVRVDFTTRDGEAVAGEDYLAAAGTVVFAPGETSANVTVEIVGDGEGEVTERFFVDLASAVGAEVRYGTGTGTILTDDALFVFETHPLVEGDPDPTLGLAHLNGEAFAVNVAEPIGREARVSWRLVGGTAATGTDVVAASGTLVFLEPTTSRAPDTGEYFDVDAVRDVVEEGAESFFVELFDPVNGTFAAERVEVAIEDDDDVCPAGPNLIVNGSVKNGLDGWTLVSGEWQATVQTVDSGYSFTPACGAKGYNELSQDVDLSGFAALIDRGEQDFRFEGYQEKLKEGQLGRVVLELYDVTRTTLLATRDFADQIPDVYVNTRHWGRMSAVLGPPPGTRWVRIRLQAEGACATRFDALKIQALAQPFVTIEDAAVVEGDFGTRDVDVAVALACPHLRPVTVDYFTADGTATAPADYTPTQGTLVFAPGELAKHVTVAVRGDVEHEGNETFRLLLASATEANVPDPEGVVTIIDDEVFATVSGAQTVEGHAGSTPLTFDVELSRASELEVRIGYATADGSAVSPEDYLASSGTLVLPPGSTHGEITVPVLGDVEQEGDECFDLLLSEAVNVTLKAPAVEGCILNDDLTVSAGDASVGEGDVGFAVVNFTLGLSLASADEVRVDWATGDGTATAGEDYVAASGTAVFPLGVTEVKVPVTVLGDDELEPTETFFLLLSSPVGAHLGDPEGTGLIVDDDDCQSLDLLANAGSEEPLDDGEIPGWVEAEGNAWSRVATAETLPFEGMTYFNAGNAPHGELRQDVDVAGFARWTDQGIQRFLFEGFVRSAPETSPDTAQVIVEYRDAANETVLGSFVSEEIANTSERWRSVLDLRLAPPGTRWLRVRLLSRRTTPSGGNDAYFDGLSLRSLGTPTLSVDDPWLLEGDVGAQALGFEVTLSCPAEEVVTIAYASADGVARAGEDYTAVDGLLGFSPGVTRQAVSVEVIGDTALEPAEWFLLELTSPSAGAVLVRPRGTGTIFDNDTTPEDLPFVSLSTAPGDGQVSIDLGAYGDWGLHLLPYRDMPNDGDARYDPLGPSGLGQTTYNALLHVGDPGKPPIGLSTGGSLTNTRAFELPNPGFIKVGPTFAVSSFEIDGLFFLLRQSVHDLVDHGERTGGVLVQSYTITNLDAVPRDFDLTRYFDGDLALGVDASRSDSGGVRVINGLEVLFEVDADYLPSVANAFVGLTGEGGIELPGERFDIDGFSALARRVRDASVFQNRIVYDFDGDGFIDPYKGYDVALARRNRFLDVPAGGSVTYLTLTIFGAAPPSDFQFEVPPLAVAGDYAGFEGVAVELDASQSFDADGALVAYDWDLDGDGDFDDATGIQVLWTFPQEGQYQIALRVTDDSGLTAIDQGEVLVVNAAPAVTAVPDFVAAGAAISQVLASFTDSGALDVHTAAIDWGEGAGLEAADVAAASGSGTVTGEHLYTVPAEYVVTVCVTDDAGATGCDALRILIEEVGEPELAAVKTDRLAEDRDGDGVASPGDLIEYEITVANAGTAEATGLVVRDNVPLHTTIVPGSLTATAGTVVGEDPPEVAIDEIAAGAAVTITFRAEIANPIAPGVADVVNQATVLSNELPAVLSDDPDIGGDADPTVTMVTAAPRLVAEKTDALAADNDGDGVPSPGDEIAYTVTLKNLGNTAATGVQFVDLVPEHTALVAGSATTSAGTVTSEDPVEASVGELPVGDEIVITFRVVVDNPVPAGVTEIVNQGAAAADGLADVLTDDPDAGGDADPTVTAITAAPVLTVEKTDVLFSDADGDSVASPGDELLYSITVANSGNTGATSVRLADAIPADTVLVPGSVQTSQGAVVSEDPVDVDLGLVDAGTTATVTFRVSVDDPFPVTETEAVNQATVTSAELEPVPSDDPDTEPAGDPTATPVFVTPDVAIDDVTVTEGDPGASVEAVLTVTLSRASNRTVTVAYETSDGSAVSGADYQASAGELLFAPGETSLSLAVPVLPDLLDELDETFTVALTSAAGGVLVDGEGLVKILDDDPPPQVAIAGVTVNETDGEAVFTVTLSAASSFDVTALYLTADATAVAGADYAAAAGAVVIPAGGLAASIVVAVLDDAFDEDDETFSVQLTNATNGVLAVAVATGTIVDDDEPPEISIGDVTVTEGTDAQALFTVSLSAVSGREIRVDYGTADSTAQAGADYTASAGTVILPAGTSSRTLAVAVLDDALDEDDETFSVQLTHATNGVIAVAVATGTIVDDDPPPTVDIGDVTVDEGDLTAVFTLRLSAESGREVRLDYATAPVTAITGTDFTATSGTAVFPAGTTEQTAAVSILDDLFDEPDESFTVVLSNPVNVTVSDGEGVGTIVDDDLPPVLAVTRVTVTEGPGVEAVFTVSLSAESGFDVTADYATADGEAVAGLDYTATSGTVSFPAGTTSATITVPIADDLLDEDDETFLLAFTNPSHVALPAAPGVATIVDDDPPPSISIADVTVTEGTGGPANAVFTLSLDAPSGRELRVSYQTADGTARASLDYTPSSGTVVFPAGATQQTVTVAVLGDALDEPDETFLVRLSSPVNVVVGDGEAAATILDDDAPPTVSIDDVAVIEGDSGNTSTTFTLTLSSASGFDVTVAWATADGTAGAGSDYTAASGTASLPAGTTSATLSVVVTGDLVDELDETFTVVLADPQHTVIADGVGEATIVDDDEALITIDDVEVEESAAAAVFTVTLATVADREIRVDYATAAETATAGVDYSNVGGTLTFPIFTTEQTLSVPVIDDTILEDRDETFRVELANAVGTTIADATGVGTILDDELCAGPNLLVNPSAELRPADGEVPGWTRQLGDWQRAFAPPDPVDGRATFFAGTSPYSELYQDVDVRAYAARISAGTQAFAFDGFVRTFDEVPPDVVRLVVEYRDAANAVVLDAYDSGEIASPFDWIRLTDVRLAPAGTGWLRVRLVASRFTGDVNDGFVDALELRSLRAPAVTIDDVTVYEGDAGTADAVFTVRLACTYEADVSAGYSTADGTAVQAEDYLPASGTVSLPSGTTAQTISVPVVGDTVDEPRESFFVELSGVVSSGSPVLLDPRGEGTILDDDFCPRSHGYWKTHTELWPVDWLVMGGVEYDAAEMLAFLNAKGGDATLHLALQLVATKLNLARGSDPSIVPTVADADAFLELYPPGSNPRGNARQEADRLKDRLDAYNNSCPE